MVPFVAAVVAAGVLVSPVPVVSKPCSDPVVQVIRDAGWKGKQVRVAYGVAWRESNFHVTEISSSGDYGLFQLNAATWQGTKYWPAQPLDALSNAKAAHRLWRDASWRPWGLNRDGTGVDMRDYNWSAWQVEHWVWRPYTVGLAKFDALPKACRS